MRFRRQDKIRLGRDYALEIWLEVAANLRFLPGLRGKGGIRVDANDPLIEPKCEEHFGVAWRDRHDAGRRSLDRHLATSIVRNSQRKRCRFCSKGSCRARHGDW